jgi:hypothetical protein
MHLREEWRLILNSLVRVPYINLGFLVAGRGFRRTKDELIGITVSTNYDDILAEILEHNISRLDHWFIVTTRGDFATQQLLQGQVKVTTLFWNPHHKGRPFDKGSGIRLAQQAAYRRFPGSWYLVLDSDIALPADFRRSLGRLSELDLLAIHGSHRINFHTLADFRTGSGGYREELFRAMPRYFQRGQREEFVRAIPGYFQLYCLPFLYRKSLTAGWVDAWFSKKFLRRRILDSVEVSHLGATGENWRGRQSERFEDALIDRRLGDQ